MPFYPVPDTVQVRFIQDFRGQLMVNTMWFEHVGGPPSILDTATISAAAGNLWAGSAATLLSSDVTFTQCITRDYTAETSWEANNGYNDVGAAGDAMPNNVALAFKWSTGQSGAAKRGRIYIGGIPRAAVVENSVSAGGFVADMLIALQGFVGPDAVAPNWQLVVAHRRTTVLGEVVWLDVGQVFPVVNVVNTDDVVDSQRRRLPGRGR